MACHTRKVSRLENVTRRNETNLELNLTFHPFPNSILNVREEVCARRGSIDILANFLGYFRLSNNVILYELMPRELVSSKNGCAISIAFQSVLKWRIPYLRTKSSTRVECLPYLGSRRSSFVINCATRLSKKTTRYNIGSVRARAAKGIERLPPTCPKLAIPLLNIFECNRLGKNPDDRLSHSSNANICQSTLQEPNWGR